jgi:hypothetical protein
VVPLLLAWLASLFIPPRTGHAAGVTLHAFYPTSMAARDNWAKTNYARPPKYTTLPVGTSALAFFFAYAGATTKDSYYVVLRKHKGATIDVLGAYTLAKGAKRASIVSFNPGVPYAAGAYDADLIIDDQRMATTTITIGGASTAAVTITKYYATTKAEVNRWYKQSGFYPLPAKAARYPAGTTTVYLFCSYQHAVPKVTTEESIVHGPGGLQVTHGPYPFTNASGGIWSVITAPQHLAFPSGTYTAVLMVNGTQTAQTAFTIG